MKAYTRLYIFCVLLQYTPLYGDQPKTTDISELMRDQLLLQQFALPITYSRESIGSFLHVRFNHKRYAPDYLAFTMNHVGMFLSFTPQTETPRSYIKSVFKLFNQKLKSTVYVNPFALIDFIESLPEKLKPFIDPCHEKESIKLQMKDELYDFIYNNFSLLKQDPETALDTLSDRLYTITQDLIDSPCVQVQQAVHQFLETALNKLVWHGSGAEIWASVKTISLILHELMQVGALHSKEDLNELYWSLLTRLAYFVDLALYDIDHEFFTQVLHDLNENHLPLWELPEQEEYITTKAIYLREILLDAIARKEAYDMGLIAR